MITSPAMQDDDDVSGRNDFLVEMKKKLKSIGSSEAGSSPQESTWSSPRGQPPAPDSNITPRDSPRVTPRVARDVTPRDSPRSTAVSRGTRVETCTRQEKNYREESVEIFPFASTNQRKVVEQAEVTSSERTSSVTSPRAFDAKSLIEEERKKFQEYKK